MQDRTQYSIVRKVPCGAVPRRSVRVAAEAARGTRRVDRGPSAVQLRVARRQRRLAAGKAILGVFQHGIELGEERHGHDARHVVARVKLALRAIRLVGAPRGGERQREVVGARSGQALDYVGAVGNDRENAWPAAASQAAGCHAPRCLDVTMEMMEIENARKCFT